MIATPAARSWLGWALSVTTEAADAIDAIWWTMHPRNRTRPTWDPEQKRWVKPGAIQQAQDIWDHFDEVDWEAAGNAIIQESLEDVLYGFAGKQAGRANRKLWESGLAGNNGFSLTRGPAL